MAENLPDLIVKTVLIKLEAMEAHDRGLLSDTSVTTFDRLIVILGSVNPRYREKLLSTKPVAEDIERVISLGQRVALRDEEVYMLATLRRFVVEMEKKGIEKLNDAITVDELGEGSEKIKVC